MKRSSVLLALLLASAGVLAGCVSHDTSEAPGAEDETVTPAGVPEAPKPDDKDENASAEADENETKGRQWHYHDYWYGSPTLTLFEDAVALDATTPSASAPPPRATIGAGTFALPRGSVVPPETGLVNVTLEWDDPLVPERLNVSFKPTNADTFIPAGTVANGGTVNVSVTMAMADAPHTAVSGWSFRVTPAPTAEGVAVGNGTVYATVMATIGRPLLIDPPHVDHWAGESTRPLVSATRTVHAGAVPADGGRYAGVAPEDENAMAQNALLEAPVTDGRVVPIGTQVVVARVTWDSPLPPEAGTPVLHWSEARSESAGIAEPDTASEGERVFRIPVNPRMTDNPYGNQSTWSFRVLLDGDEGVFSGSVTLDAWVSRLPVDAAPVPAGRAE